MAYLGSGKVQMKPLPKACLIIALFNLLLGPALGLANSASDRPGSGEFDRLIKVIRTGNPYQRSQAVAPFASIDDTRVVPILMDLLKDSDQAVRFYAAQQLERLADSRSADALARVLDDSSGNVRRFAAQALAKIGDERHVPALVAAVMSNLPEPNQVGIRSWHLWPVLETIGRLSPQAPPEIVGLLDRISDEKIAQDEDWWRICQKVANCLAAIGDTSAVDELKRADEILSCRHCDYNTWHAVRRTLAVLDPQHVTFQNPAADILASVRFGKTTDEHIRKTWVEPLAALASKALDDLEWALKFPAQWDSPRRQVAIQTLGRIADPSAARVLRDYIARFGERAALSRNERRAEQSLLSRALLALLQADPTEQTVEQVISCLPRLEDFQQEYFMHNVANESLPAIPLAARISLYGRVLLDPEPAKSFGQYAPGAAARLLGEIGGPEAGKTLSQALLEPTGNGNTAAAARALGDIEDYDALPTLIAAAARPNVPVAPVAKSMGRINDPAALPVLEQLAKRQGLSRSDSLWIAAACARLGKDYDHNSRTIREALPESLEQAAWLSDSRTVAAVAAFAHAADYTGQRAIMTLEAIGTRQVFDTLKQLIDVGNITDPRRFELIAAATARIAAGLGLDSADHYGEIAEVARLVPGWFEIHQLPSFDQRPPSDLLKTHAPVARMLWAAEAIRRLDLAAENNTEDWQSDIPGQAVTAVCEIYDPELIPVLERIAKESSSRVTFHTPDKPVQFYHVRSLTAKILADKTGRPHTFIDADGRTRPGGWRPSDEHIRYQGRPRQQ